MAKIICYLGQIEGLFKYLYNPNSKEIIRLEQTGEIINAQKLNIDPNDESILLENTYKHWGKPISIEESYFNNWYIKNLKK